jgi:hypothetical protein
LRPPALALPGYALPPGAQEALKWFAVVCMTADHLNRFLLHDAHPWMFALGRLAMPIFAFTLAYNLAQPRALARGMHQRVMRRLGLAALAATPAYLALSHPLQGWWPLNILVTLLAGTALLALLDSGRRYRHALALALFVLAGAWVEYWWAGLAFMLAAARYVRKPDLYALAALLLCLLLLANLNGNAWDFACLPLLALAPSLRLRLPRLRHVLYAYYPLHLSAIWVAAQWLRA